jgi:hypothetical protein
MKPSRPSVLVVAVTLALAACQQETAEVASDPAASESLVLTTSMNEVVTAETQNILNVLIEALNEQAEVDPAKLTDDDWTAMETAAVRLRDEALAMRDRDIQVVAAPGETIDGEDNPGALSAADVQARIDANPDGFKTHAEVLLAEAERLVTASQERDGATLWDVSLNMDPVCTDCHQQYWYPDPAP